MFQSARLKLTLWYLLIITVISLLFSTVIYRSLTSELDRMSRPHRRGSQIRMALDQDIVHAVKNKIKFNLLLVNTIILGASGISAYFLAGKTLRPIQHMVDEQHRFISDASHELRTPLTALRTSIEVNLRDEKMSIKAAKELLKSNLEEVNNLQELSDSLIKLTQYQQNGDAIPFSMVSLKEIVTEATRKMAPIAENKKIVIKHEIKEEELEGNKQLLVELLVILFDNAIKYSEPETSLTIHTKSAINSVIVDVSDQGTGINKTDIPHIFDRFYRADNSRTKSEVSGYGLGLSIARKIVKLHKGSIFVKSELGKGATFVITLPKKQIHIS